MESGEDKNFLEELSDELSLALGRAIWEFARIEQLTYRFIEKLSKEDLNQLIGYQQIGKRIDLVEKLIARISGHENEKSQALVAIKKIKPLITDRNTLAHNPWLIWIDFELHDFVTEIQSASNPNVRLDLDSVKEFTSQAHNLVLELNDALTSLTLKLKEF